MLVKPSVPEHFAQNVSVGEDCGWKMGPYLFLVHEARDLKHVALRTPWIDNRIPSTEPISFYKDS